ncbi:MAG: DNA repair protein RadC [Prevotella sp.]|jgi:DNA repair protein RadC|nr:DNA repair protein RadC [Prevotella sp.]
MSERLTIAHWSEDDQPREKLRDNGAQALSDAELLAILVGSGSSQEDAVSLMKRILSDCNNNLNALGKMSIRQLCEYKGIGEAKAITILAACELGKRRQMEKPEERPDLGTATKIYNHMHPLLQDSDVEEFWLLLMNQNFRLIKQVRISHGGITETAVDIRIIMREAVLANATIIAVCHNHPSGNLRPSQHDNDLTAQLQQACKLMRIHFMDHVILTDGNYFSYHETGRL